MKAAYKWRLGNGIYGYLIDETGNSVPFSYSLNDYIRLYYGGGVVTGTSVDDGTISTIVSKMTKNEYINQFEEFKKFINEAYPQVSLLDVNYYYDIENDECTNSASSLKCSATDIIFEATAVSGEPIKAVVTNVQPHTDNEDALRYRIDFTIPPGEQGPVGATPNIEVGSVTTTTIAAGSDANVTVTRNQESTDEEPVFDFEFDIPRGEGSLTLIGGRNIEAIITGTTGDEVVVNALGYTWDSEKESFYEGNSSTASGECSHAEGITTGAYGKASHAEGDSTEANGEYSHAEGHYTEASGEASHSEGDNTTANGYTSHAEGYKTEAFGDYSHAEGFDSYAYGVSSHAEGKNTAASGENSHTGGRGTRANQDCMTAIGKYNKTYNVNSATTLFVVGDGTSSASTHNAFEVINEVGKDTTYSTRATVNGFDNVLLGMPIGSVVLWGGVSSVNVPEGWLLCNGGTIEVVSTNVTDCDFFHKISDKVGANYKAKDDIYRPLCKVIRDYYGFVTNTIQDQGTKDYILLPNIPSVVSTNSGSGLVNTVTSNMNYIIKYK